MRFGEALHILRRRWPVVIVAVLLAVAAGWFTAPEPREAEAPRRVTEYTGSQTLVRSTDASTTSSSEISLPLLVRLAETGDVPAAVIERLGLDTSPDLLAGRVEVEVDPAMGIITISSSGTDQDEVVALVDAYADELLRFATERNTSLQADSLERVRRLVREQQERVRELDAEVQLLPPDSVDWLLVRAERDALVATYGKNLQRMEELVSRPPSDPGMTRLGEIVAVPTSTSVFAPPPTDHSQRALGGGALGLLLGFGLAFAVDRADRRLHTRDQIEGVYRAPILSEIDLPRAESDPAAVLDAPVEEDAIQAFARVGMAVLHRTPAVRDRGVPAAGVEHGNGRTGAKVVLVTSAGSGDGRTTALAHMAGAVSATGHRVLVTGTGDHWREASAALSAEESDGALLATAIPGVRVSARKLSVHDDLGASFGADLFRFDLVLIDAGPVLGSGDAAALLHAVDVVLLVARRGWSRSDTVERAHDYLDQVGVSSEGIVLLRFTRTQRGQRGDPSTALDIYRRRAAAASRGGLAPTPADPVPAAWHARRGSRKR